MKLSKLWLREWVNFSLNEHELASQLTMAGLEVDAVSPVAGSFTKVIVAKVLSTRPHPNADKLTICEVDAQLETPLQVVCGARNVRPGLKVALAMVGAQLPGDFKIKESKLRGELSQGMLCSVSELGMAEHSEGIMELEENAPIGMDLREFLALDDQIIDVDLTPNRADCFSVLGVAREIAALNNLPLQNKEFSAIVPVIDESKVIKLHSSDACPHYAARVIKNINPHALTPLWMQERLRRSGLRSIHPVVDVLNYVMLELGQPMHAFDLNTIAGDIQVRFSQGNERLKLLDGQEIELTEQVLIIADSNKPLAIAGVMGGAESSVQTHTTDLLVESAFFNPVVIAGVARKFSLFSDSSQRFERGVDPQLQIKALEYATSLLLDIVGGEAGPLVDIEDPQKIPSSVEFSFDTRKIKRLTGLEIATEALTTFLQGLGITINKIEGPFFHVKIPSHRFDIQQDVDLVEEVVRLYGYDKLPISPMRAPIHAGTMCSSEAIAQQITQWLVARGYNETISYSFVDPELQEAFYPQTPSMQLLNPISSELSQMRKGLWPGLIASMIHNVHRQQNVIQFFEFGVVFDCVSGTLQERPALAGLVSGEYGALHWGENTHLYDFFDAKGDLEALFNQLKLNVQFKGAEHDALHPGQSAQIFIEGHCAGWIGALHPRLLDELDLKNDVFLFEINLNALTNRQPIRYQPISKYPQIRRDLSFIIDKEIEIGAIEQVVRETIKENWLKSFDVFDVYMGAGIPDSQKSVAISLNLQDDKRTLVDTEINSLISAILKSLENKFSIILRE